MSGRFDVIITGLGPAGAAAGVELARAGARVLALSGNPLNRKPCGGCLSARSLGLLDWLDPPDWLHRHPVAKLWLLAPGLPPGRFKTNEPGAYLLDRLRFDNFLARRAGESGVQIISQRTRDFTFHPQGFKVRTQEREFRTDWLLGGDGAFSLLGRRLGLGRTRFIYKALMEERPAPLRMAEHLEGAALLELGGTERGYGWAFLRGDILNLGMIEHGGAYFRKNDSLMRRYQKFLARLGLEPPKRWQGGAIPCPDGRPVRLVKGRAAVLGDAGGLADPFLAEGIGQAICSGRQAARAILAGDLTLYQANMERTLLREHFYARQLARLTFEWPGLIQSLARRHPGIVEMGWGLLRGEITFKGLAPALTRAWLRNRCEWFKQKSRSARFGTSE